MSSGKENQELVLVADAPAIVGGKAKKRGRPRKIRAEVIEHGTPKKPGKRGRPRLDKPPAPKPKAPRIIRPPIAAHPTFKEMVITVMREIGEKIPASRKVIRSAVEAKYGLNHTGFNSYLNKTLSRLVTEGNLYHPKKNPGKYRINTEHEDFGSLKQKERKGRPRKSLVLTKIAKKKLKTPKKSAVKKPKPKIDKEPKVGKDPKVKRGRGRPKKK